jgi:hypothetical protein
MQDYLGRTVLQEAAVTGQLDRVMQSLRASQEKLTLDHFLIQATDGWTSLHAAAWGGHLDQVKEALVISGEKLEPSHFLIKDSRGWTPLRAAAQRNHLDQIFVPSYWKCQVGEMIRCWEKVPEEQRGSVDFDKLLAEAIFLSVHSAPKVDPEALRHATRSSASPVPTEQPSDKDLTR